MNPSTDITESIIPKKSRFAINPKTIYITATPIGNLGDITIRALEVLQDVDFIVCEDTRKTGVLLQYYGIKSKLFIYNDHSNDIQRSKLLCMLQSGKSAALVSDAGMPLISDPGYKLIGDCIKEGVSFSVIPGASSTISAIALSGLPSDKFLFYGFLPDKSSARKKVLDDIQFLQYTLILFETAKRLKDSLKDMNEFMPFRKISIAREITKLHEEVYRGTISEAVAWADSHTHLKGEIVIVLDGYHKVNTSSDEEIKNIALNMLKTSSLKDTVEEISKTFSIKKKQVYEICLKLID
jgi:16S rRNA (cytidine1402-2'-O)-methyltransferase